MSQTASRTRRTLATLVTAAGAIVLTLAATEASIIKPAAGPKVDAEALLEEATDVVSFEIRYPRSLPDPLTLDNVIWAGADPKDFPEADEFTVDYWFADGKGNRLHVWQTNATGIGPSDPTTSGSGEPLDIAGVTWIYEEVDVGSYSTQQLSRRLRDGVLVSLDYSDLSVLVEIAAQLQ